MMLNKMKSPYKIPFILGKEITDMTRCNTDQFSVTAPGSVSTPVICGMNTGEHSKHFSKYLFFRSNSRFFSIQCMSMPLINAIL